MPPAAAASIKSRAATIIMLPSGSSLGGGDGMGLAGCSADVGALLLMLRGDFLTSGGGVALGAGCFACGGGVGSATGLAAMGVGVACVLAVLRVTLESVFGATVEDTGVLSFGSRALCCLSG